jgi:hypothetical protein
MDAYANFAYSTVATPPSPATTGTSIGLPTGHAARFPTPPFNVVVTEANTIPTVLNSEIVRVTAIVGDTLTVTRNQETSLAFASSRAIIAGDQIYAGLTKLFVDQLAAAGGATLGTTLVDVAFNAADFTASGGGLTINSQFTNAYVVVGKIVTWFFHYNLTMTGSVNKIFIKVPGSYTPARHTGGGNTVYGGPMSGNAGTFIPISASQLEITPNGFAGTFTAGTYNLGGSIVFFAN